MLSAMLRRSHLASFIVLALATLAAAGCQRRGGCTGPNCGTLINAAVGEPSTLLPPSTEEVVASDIAEQLFLKLADVGMSENTLGDEDFQPLLAQKWEWDGPLTLVFHLDPRARWQDGQPVTAADVEFTFNAYTDSLVASPYRPKLSRVTSVTQRDSLTAVFRFKDRYPEMFYDAVYHMRILPAHLLRPVPRDQWRTAAFGRDPVGDGPYRFVRWQPAQSIELVADSTFFLGRPGVRRLIWRFTPNLQVALQQVIADQADVREQLVTPDNVERARGNAACRVPVPRQCLYLSLRQLPRGR
jgi:peptide/nickel transport system substrate-binding protein